MIAPCLGKLKVSVQFYLSETKAQDIFFGKIKRAVSKTHSMRKTSFSKVDNNKIAEIIEFFFSKYFLEPLRQFETKPLII